MYIYYIILLKYIDINKLPKKSTYNSFKISIEFEIIFNFPIKSSDTALFFQKIYIYIYFIYIK